MPDLLDESMFTMKVFDFLLEEKEWKNRSSMPCCVLFYTNWCTHCRDTQIAFNQLSEKYEKSINFYIINCDDSPNLSAALKIISVPVIVFVPLKGEPQLLKGYFSNNMIEHLIKDILISTK